MASLSRTLPSLALLIGLAAAASAQNTRLWTQSRFEEFEKGTPQAVSISSDGRLTAGPGLTDLASTPSTLVWSVAADKSGTAYLATGSPATVLRVGADNKPVAIFKTKDVAVQVVRIAPDGALYAATLPGGRVYKLNPAATDAQDESNATVVFDMAKLDPAPAAAEKRPDAKPHYIWDMIFDAQGRLYIGTGGPAAVYRIDPAKPTAAPETFFSSDEAHIRSLTWDTKGILLAGSEGTGLVYRISPDGKGYVLFDSPRREVTSLAVALDGTIYAACVGEKGRIALPQLPVQSPGNASVNAVQPPSLSAANTSSSLPDGSEIYALKDDQAPRKLWASKDDIVYALLARTNDLLALTGNRGRILSIAANGSYADIGHLAAQQGLGFALSSSSVLIGTGNTGKLVRLAPATHSEYLSDILDAKAFARFGRVEFDPASSGFEIFTRTGNIEQPARGWADWQPLKDGVVASPAGRFLQWKAVLEAKGSLAAVGVNFLPVNTAPVVDDILAVSGARWSSQAVAAGSATVNISFAAPVQTATTTDPSAVTPLQAAKDRASVTARWATHDDDGDELTYALYLRGDGESAWRLVKDKISDKALSFDATRIPDGGYQVRVIASDAPAHNPGDELSAEKISPRFVVDTTPPVLANVKASGSAVQCAAGVCTQSLAISFDADDATSPIARAEYSIDAGPWQFLAPVGKLSDSRHEHYELHVPAAESANRASEHLITVRAADRYDNVGVARAIVPAGK